MFLLKINYNSEPPIIEKINLGEYIKTCEKCNKKYCGFYLNICCENNYCFNCFKDNIYYSKYHELKNKDILNSCSCEICLIKKNIYLCPICQTKIFIEDEILKHEE